MADLVVKAGFYKDGEVLGKIEHSLPLCLQRSFLTGTLQSDVGDRSGMHRRWVMARDAFLKPFRFLSNARWKCI